MNYIKKVVIISLLLILCSCGKKMELDSIYRDIFVYGNNVYACSKDKLYRIDTYGNILDSWMFSDYSIRSFCINEDGAIFADEEKNSLVFLDDDFNIKNEFDISLEQNYFIEDIQYICNNKIMLASFHEDYGYKFNVISIDATNDDKIETIRTDFRVDAYAVYPESRILLYSRNFPSLYFFAEILDNKRNYEYCDFNGPADTEYMMLLGDNLYLLAGDKIYCTDIQFRECKILVNDIFADFDIQSVYSINFYNGNLLVSGTNSKKNPTFTNIDTNNIPMQQDDKGDRVS